MEPSVGLELMTLRLRPELSFESRMLNELSPPGTLRGLRFKRKECHNSGPSELTY